MCHNYTFQCRHVIHKYTAGSPNISTDRKRSSLTHTRYHACEPLKSGLSGTVFSSQHIPQFLAVWLKKLNCFKLLNMKWKVSVSPRTVICPVLWIAYTNTRPTLFILRNENLSWEKGLSSVKISEERHFYCWSLTRTVFWWG